MSRDLVLDVIARKNSRDLSTLADEFGRLGKQTDDAGKKMHDLGTFSQFLDQELAKTKALVAQLGQEFERTGDKDVFAKLRGAQGNVKSLEKIKGDLTKSLETGAEDAKKGVEKALSDAGKNGGKGLFKQVESAFSEGGVSFGSVMAGVLIAGAPLIGAAINGVLVAGVGLGGVATGIVGQLHDPEVHKALVGLGNNLLGDLHMDTAPFKAPLLSAIATVGGALQNMLNSIDFGKLAQALGPLANGIAGLFDKMGPGFNEALGAAVPVLSAIGAELPGIGEAIGSFFHELAGSSTGAVEGIRTLLAAIGGLIEMSGLLIGALSNAYAFIIRLGDGMSGWAAKMANGIPVLSSIANTAHTLFEGIRFGSGDVTTLGRSFTAMAADATLTQDDLDALAGKINQVATTADTLAASMANRLFTATMGVDQATLGWYTSLTNLSETLASNGLAIDRHTHLIALNTKHGEENRQAILAAVQANMAQYQANIAVGMSATDAAAAYDKNTEALRRQLEKAHYTSAQIQDLIGKYAGIPDTVNTTIATQGLTGAINDLITLLEKINNINQHRFTFTVVGNIVYHGEDPSNFYHGLATGGRVPGYAGGGGVIRVGEMGPEILRMPAISAPAYVTPNSALNGTANGGAGQIQTLRVILEWPDGAIIRERLVDLGRGRGYNTVDELLPVSSAR